MDMARRPALSDDSITDVFAELYFEARPETHPNISGFHLNKLFNAEKMILTKTHAVLESEQPRPGDRRGQADRMWLRLQNVPGHSSRRSRQLSKSAPTLLNENKETHNNTPN